MALTFFTMLNKLSHKDFDFASEDIPYLANHFRYLLLSGAPATLLDDVYPLCDEEITKQIFNEGRSLFRKVCERGHVQTIEWLSNRPEVQAHLHDYLEKGDYMLFSGAATSGHFGMLMWLLAQAEKLQCKEELENALQERGSSISRLESIALYMLARSSPAQQAHDKLEVLEERETTNTGLNRYGFKPHLYEKIYPIAELASAGEGSFNEGLDAFRTAVLFTDVQDLQRYVDKYEKTWAQNPRMIMHDAMLFDLPPEGKWHPGQWKQLLMRHGPKASRFIALAPKIEHYAHEHGIDLPSVTADELRDIGMHCSYDRKSEDLNFARLAFACGISEQGFNKALDIMATRSKTADKLPDITIDGDTIGMPGYVFEKLPSNDPTGFVLGALTNCCQNIDNFMYNGTACAEHGMTSPNGGFYVWRRKTSKRTPEDIIAQSWAWIGKDNSLVLDSFEDRSNKYDDLAKPFLEQFAYEVKTHHRDFKLVKIGMGGHTPQAMGFESVDASIPMDIERYGDSSEQALVPPVNHKIQKFSEPDGATVSAKIRC